MHTHAAAVYAHARWLTGNRPDAEDLTQDVFIRAFRALSGASPRNYRGWLRRITLNLFLDQWRRRQIIGFDALPEPVALTMADPRPDPAETLDRRCFDGDVEQALAALPADSRAAVLLCDVEGLTYDEIAARLGVRRGTVGSRIHRGRRQLRSALAERRPAREFVASP